jgi:predicted kinase
MTRPGGAWVPDGRAKAILGDCQASLAVLDGLEIDLYLIHAPDPRRPWRTALRALTRLVEEGLVKRVGVSNVNRGQLDEALDLDPAVVAIPGAQRPETARSAAFAATIELDERERTALGEAFGSVRRAPVTRTRSVDDGDVVLVMGIPGAGKSRVAEGYVARGYVRLNRDERGGSLRQLADALEAELASGARRAVLDNTYLTRAARSHVIETASRHGLPDRCIWLDTPLGQAQVNLVERLIDRLGSLPGPEELRVLARRGDGVLAPTPQMPALRELEPPAADEGWASLERVPFERSSGPRGGKAGVFVAAVAMDQPGWKEALREGNRDAPHLIFDWRPGGTPDALAPAVETLASEVTGRVEGALCPHGAGPPTCWCRPPLPGLPLAFARAHGLDPSRAILIGARPAHRQQRYRCPTRGRCSRRSGTAGPSCPPARCR